MKHIIILFINQYAPVPLILPIHTNIGGGKGWGFGAAAPPHFKGAP